MEIILYQSHQTIDNARKVTSISDIKDNVRLFYEMGYYPTKNDVIKHTNFTRTGVFKEILDVKSFIEGDERLSDVEYINHHNFVIVDI